MKKGSIVCFFLVVTTISALGFVCLFHTVRTEKECMLSMFTDDGTLTYQSWGAKVRTSFFQVRIYEAVKPFDLKSCKETCVVYEKSLEPAYDFHINDYRISKKREKTIIDKIKSRSRAKKVLLIRTLKGAPVCIFTGNSIKQKQANNCTIIKIDGIYVYIINANADIFD